MFGKKSTGIGWLVTAAVIGGGAFGLSAPPANADASGYITALDAQGITYASVPAAIKSGQSLCRTMDAGATFDTAALIVFNNSELDMFNSGYVVGAAIGALCPWNTYKLGSVAL